VDVSDHNKKMFWKVAASNSRFAFQNYLSLFDLKWNRSYYTEVKSREPASLDFLGLESWSTELQIAYLRFIASIIDNTVAVKEQKVILAHIFESLPERNLPKYMSDEEGAELSAEEFLKVFGEKSTKVLC
jgi:hypothetical protein